MCFYLFAINKGSIELNDPSPHIYYHYVIILRSGYMYS